MVLIHRKFLLLMKLLLLPIVLISKGFQDKPLPSDHHQYTHFTVNDGLPSSEVYRALQDSKGFLWFSTDRGVSRYDGKKFETFTTIDGLCDNTIFNITETEDGAIWLRGFNGKLSFYKDGHIHPYHFKKNIKELIGGNIPRDILVAPDGRKLITYGRHCIILNKDGDLLRVLPKEKEDTGFEFFFFKGMPLIGFYRGLQPLGKTVFYLNDTSIHVDLPRGFSTSSNGFYYGGIRHSNGDIFITFFDWLYQFRANKLIARVRLPTINAAYLYEDSRGDLWVGLLSRNGVLRYKNADINKDPENHLKGETITSVYEDHEKGLWFTSEDNGVFYLNSILNRNFPSPAVIMLQLVKGNLMYTLDDGTAKFMSLQDYKTLDKSIQTHPKSFPVYEEGRYYTQAAGIELVVVNDSITQVKSTSPNIVFNDTIIWTAGFRDLFKFNAKNGYKEEFHFGSRILTLKNESDTSLLLGTLTGLYRFNKPNARHSPITTHPLLSERINDMVALHDSLMVYALHGFGLLIQNKKEFTHLTTNDGLLSNTCHRLRVDEKNNLWVATNYGVNMISQVGTNNFQVINEFTIADGMLSNEALDIYATSDKLYVGSKKGLSILPLLKESHLNTPIYLNYIKINDADTSPHNYYDLGYKQNKISLSLTGITFKGRKKLQYKYKMHGYDERWTISTENQLNFKLPSGTYTFEAYAGTGNDQWSKTPIILSFDIAAPFWKKVWFWIAVHIFIAVVIGLIAKYRNRMVRARIQLKEELNNAKQEALSAQMNPHFMFNSLNSLQSEIMKGNKYSATVHVAKFSRLMRKILANSREKLVSIDNAIDSLKLYMELEQNRTQNKFDYRINIEEGIDPTEIKIPPLLIQPLVENAIWHGIVPKKEKGMIHISISLKEGCIYCEVTDNGVGRAYHKNTGKNREFESVGNRITAKRIELMNAMHKKKIEYQIKDLYEDKTPVGTQVTFAIPIIKSENENAKSNTNR